MTLAVFGSGAVVGSFVVILTVTLIWFLVITKKTDWYVPASWFLVCLTLGTLFTLSYLRGLGAAAGFLTAYVALSWIPPFMGFHVGMEALSILIVTSVIAAIEFIILVLFQIFLTFKISTIFSPCDR
ncbi:hypothetical protein [Chlorogloeopsis sp. ULAP02]|uniref:hypothetical protein n=1 Tax=Chlorogloeopsis sp. ULAP02 TaxID=3107926 RepID=UPI00313626DA